MYRYLVLVPEMKGVWGGPAVLKKLHRRCVLGTFLLSKLLLDTLKTTAKETGEEGRIINVASEAHKYTYKGGIIFDKLNDASRYQTEYI